MFSTCTLNLAACSGYTRTEKIQRPGDHGGLPINPKPKTLVDRMVALQLSMTADFRQTLALILDPHLGSDSRCINIEPSRITWNCPSDTTGVGLKGVMHLKMDPSGGIELTSGPDELSGEFVALGKKRIVHLQKTLSLTKLSGTEALAGATTYGFTQSTSLIFDYPTLKGSSRYRFDFTARGTAVINPGLPAKWGFSTYSSSLEQYQWATKDSITPPGDANHWVLDLTSEGPVRSDQCGIANGVFKLSGTQQKPVDIYSGTTKGIGTVGDVTQIRWPRCQSATRFALQLWRPFIFDPAP